MAIVALMTTAMIGMLGLAIDGGRIFVERRLDQNAVDAAALGAADGYYGATQHSPVSTTPVADGFTAGLAEFGKAVGQTGVWSPTGTAPSDCTATPTSANYPPDISADPPANGVKYSQGGYTLLLTVWAAPHASLPGLCVFNASSAHSIPMAFIEVLNNLSSASVTATGTAVSAFAFSPPALLVLDQVPCGNPQTGSQALKIDGNQVLTINGVTWSDGNIFRQNATVVAKGDVFDRCDATVPFTPVPPSVGIGNAPYLPDPLINYPSKFTGASGYYAPYTSTPATDTTDATAQSSVELEPGVYSNTNSFGNGSVGGCWFMEPGIYTWPSTKAQGALIYNTSPGKPGVVMSNELTSPDGSNPGTIRPPHNSTLDATILQSTESPLFDWTDSSQTCHGKVQAFNGSSAPSACLVPLVNCALTYSFRVTSVRAECLPATTTGGACANADTYWRESNLSSTCVTVAGFGNSHQAQFGISNVPGMGNPIRGDGFDTTYKTEYHIYASTYGCNGPFGYVGKATFVNGTATQTQGALGGCPFLPGTVPASVNKGLVDASCSLGYVFSGQIDQTALGATFPISSPALCTIPNQSNADWTPASGCQPAYLSGSNPNIGIANSNPDTANEDYCASGPTAVAPASPGAICSSSPIGGAAPITPGGAMFYFPSTSTCIFQDKGTPYLFGALQFRSVVMYAAAPGTCGNNGAQINGGAGGQFIGQVYMPGIGLFLKVAGGGSPIDGAIDIWQMEVTGNSNTTLTGKFPHTTVVTPAKLIVCTDPTQPVSTYCPPT